MATDAAVQELVRQGSRIAEGQGELVASIRALVESQMQRAQGGGKKDSSIMDLKAFQKLKEFRGTDYLSFKRKIQALIKKVHGEGGVRALQEAEVTADTSTGNMSADCLEIANDLEAAFHFLLEGEPAVGIGVHCGEFFQKLLLHRACLRRHVDHFLV